jgi:hypothetical protein
MGGLINQKNWTLHEVKRRLEAGEELSTLQQTYDGGGWRLCATIYALKLEGLPILSYRKKEFGRCMFYRLSHCLSRPEQEDIFGYCGDIGLIE